MRVAATLRPADQNINISPLCTFTRLGSKGSLHRLESEVLLMGALSNAFPRAVQREFWRLIKQGVVPRDAARRVGVSERSGAYWYRECGGMAPLDLREPSGRYLCLAEREEIAVLRAQGLSGQAIGEVLGRSASTISREIARNSPSGHYGSEYRAGTAQGKAELRARRPKISKLARCQRLREYVQDSLGDEQHWSPEQISHRLVEDFPDDAHMRISDEAIYQALYVQGRGGLRRELTACLRTGRSVRKPARRVEARGRRVIPAELMISQRPAEVEDRAVPGHWEGDLITGRQNKSAIGTLVERSTRFVLLLHLPDDHGAHSVRAAIAASIATLPAQLRRSLTWDQGAELAEHAHLSIATDVAIYFCDPHSPWQRGTNENTNGLLRQYFPKGTNLAVHQPAHLAKIAAALNGRPRKTLGWKTPAEAMAALLSKAS
jgi:transposase, IS30 family